MMARMAMGALLLGLWAVPIHASTCKGETACKACKDCTRCGYCNSGKGSCGVKREEEDRRHEARKKAAHPSI